MKFPVWQLADDEVESWAATIAKRIRTVFRHCNQAQCKGVPTWVSEIFEAKEHADTAEDNYNDDADDDEADHCDDDAEDEESEEEGEETKHQAAVDEATETLMAKKEVTDPAPLGEVFAASPPKPAVKTAEQTDDWPYRGWCKLFCKAWESNRKAPKKKVYSDTITIPEGAKPIDPVVAIYADGTQMRIPERTVEQHTASSSKETAVIAVHGSKKKRRRVMCCGAASMRSLASPCD